MAPDGRSGAARRRQIGAYGPTCRNGSVGGRTRKSAGTSRYRQLLEGFDGNRPFPARRMKSVPCGAVNDSAIRRARC